nr:MAG TPA: hypothetical protein [Caudoviricetes sp.]
MQKSRYLISIYTFYSLFLLENYTNQNKYEQETT